MAVFTEDSETELTVLANGEIQVKRIDRILRDGVVVSAVPHRHVVLPGDDTTGQHERVAAVANAVWTPEMVARQKAKADAMQKKFETLSVKKP